MKYYALIILYILFCALKYHFGNNGIKFTITFGKLGLFSYEYKTCCSFHSENNNEEDEETN